MRNLLITASMAVALSACQNPSTQSDTSVAPVETTTPAAYDVAAQYAKFAPVKMDVDTAFLSPSERAVVNKLIKASEYMSEIYLRQLNPANPALRAQIAASGRKDKKMLLKMFDQHFGVCDTLDEGHVFFGETPCPVGSSLATTRCAHRVRRPDRSRTRGAPRRGARSDRRAGRQSTCRRAGSSTPVRTSCRET